jgi:uncharacterized protein
MPGYSVRGPLCPAPRGSCRRRVPETRKLAQAGISVFAVSTFDTDYLLVKENDLEKALEVLGPQAGPAGL